MCELFMTPNYPSLCCIWFMTFKYFRIERDNNVRLALFNTLQS